MPVLVNRRLPEAGRIRIGKKGDRGQPQKLTTFRLTSKDHTALLAASGLYGGDVKPWPGHEGEWDLITETAEIPILVSPEPPTQWYELWSAGGCKRRCDGTTCTIPAEKDTVEQVSCKCDPDHRECHLITRVSFVLPDLPTLGIWRLDTQSYYAASELPEMIEWLQMAKARMHFPEALLALEIRTVVRNGQTKKFPVVTIRTRQTVRELLASAPPVQIVPTKEDAQAHVKMLPAPEAPEVPGPASGGAYADDYGVEAVEPPEAESGPRKASLTQNQREATRLYNQRKKVLKYYCDQCGMSVRAVVDKMHPELSEIAVQDLTSEQLQAVIDNTTAEADYAKKGAEA